MNMIRPLLEMGPVPESVLHRIETLQAQSFGERLWRKDPSLWKTDPASQKSIVGALGWLRVVEQMRGQLDDLAEFVREVRQAGFRHVLHLGMGGSSLAPLVFARSFAPADGHLRLSVLDTTDPASVAAVEQGLPLADTLFILASKSGTTAEVHALGEYFYAKLREASGQRAGENFVAITDPGTPLVGLARQRGFRRIFPGVADIGGRYSALSYFGLVPIALLGVDTGELLTRALRMAQACGPGVPAADNPGVVLGAAIGESARQGRDKLTLLVPESIATLGMWLEQLLAESTGKEGKGILPVAGEPLAAADAYGNDRLFVELRLRQSPDRELEAATAGLRKAGHPVITIPLDDRLDLGQEFFRWEVATATAGAILGINPFDQPNVQESKQNTERVLKTFAQQGRLPEETPILVEEPLRLYAPQAAPTLAQSLAQFLAAARPGDYVALMAYFIEDAQTQPMLESIRQMIQARTRAATTLGYGPRFLHSTGQFHKGGPNTGLFLQLTAGDEVDLPIPGEPYSFGTLKHAQAIGDLEALRQHGRRVVRIDLGADLGAGLAALATAIQAAQEEA
jgi:glucose-6-phosphate isomerase